MKSVQAAGSRKRAVARATIKEGTGMVRVNNVLLANHEPKLAREKIMEPLRLAGSYTDKYDIIIRINGGGIIAQAEAARLAVARGLVEMTKSTGLKNTYLKYDRHLLVADVRRKEMCKPNDSKARAKRQKSYR